MSVSRWLSWFQNAIGVGSRRSVPVSRRRPGIETLEDRVVLSSLFGSGGGTAPEGEMADAAQVRSAELFVLDPLPDISKRGATRDDVITQPPDTVHLRADTDTGVSNTDGITRDPAPVVRGFAEPGAIVRLLVDGVEVGQTRGTNDSWELSTGTLSQGQHVITATAEDADGNVSELSRPVNITIDTEAPPPIGGVTPVDDGQLLAGRRTVRVHFAESVDVPLLRQTNAVRIVEAGADGQFNTADDVSPDVALDFRDNDRLLLIQTAGLNPGDYQIQIQQNAVADLAGNVLGTGSFTSRFEVIPTTILVHNFDNDGLYTVDPIAGTVSALPDTNETFFDIAFHESVGLFGINSTGRLFRINPQTGESTLVGNTGFNINGLVFRSDGTLFGSGGDLVQIDPLTGTATVVNNLGSFVSSGDLEFDSDGALYMTADLAANQSRLVRIDLDANTATLVGPIGEFGRVLGLTFSLDGILYGVTETRNVISIDPSTGLGTLLHELTDSAVTGPGGATLFGVD